MQCIDAVRGNACRTRNDSGLSSALVLCLLVLAACSEQLIPAPIQQQSPIENHSVAANVSDTTDILHFFEKDPSYTITYRISSDHPDELASAMVTVYQQSGVQRREDIVTEATETRMLRIGAEEEVCYDIGGHWACEEAPMLPRRFEQLRSDISMAPENYQISESIVRRAADVISSCFVATKEEITAEYCFSQSGVITYAKLSEGEYTSIYLGLSLREDVDQSVFTLDQE